jgi:hypothetical protein
MPALTPELGQSSRPRGAITAVQDVLRLRMRTASVSMTSARERGHILASRVSQTSGCLSGHRLDQTREDKGVVDK